MEVQITKLLHFSFLFSGWLGRGRGDWGWLYLINSLQKKNRQPPSCIVKFLQILCSSCIHLILVVFGKDIVSGGGERGSDNSTVAYNAQFPWSTLYQLNLLWPQCKHILFTLLTLLGHLIIMWRSGRCKHVHGAMKMFFMKHTSYSFKISSKNTTFIPTWHFLFNILIFFIPIY